MAIVTPKYRVLLDDTDSVSVNQARALVQLVAPETSVFWNLLPFSEPIRQLQYDIGNRALSPRTAISDVAITTGATAITLNAATKGRVTQGHILYDPTTKQRFVIGAVVQSTGVCQIAVVKQAPGGSRTEVTAGATLYILSQSELFEEINADSRFEETDYNTNYVQDTTEKLTFSTADLREIRKWGVDKRTRVEERMRDIMKDLNLACYFGVPSATNGTLPAMTAGFDYVVENAGNTVDAAASGTADLADIRGVLKTLAKNGVGPSDGLTAVMSVDLFHAYEDAGLATLEISGQPGAEYVIGNQVKGITFSGLGFVPFYADPYLPSEDDRVRFVSTKHASKAYYQGLGDGALIEQMRIIDEPSLSTSKVQVSTIQQKWGSDFRNAASAHYILDKTGLNA